MGIRRTIRRRFRAVPVCLAVAASLVAGCQPAPRPDATPSGSRAALTYEQAVGRIPLNGTARVPINWRLPPASDAVSAGQRWLAFSELIGSVPDPRRYAYLIDYVSTGGLNRIDHRAWDAAARQDKPAGGPLWIWLDTPQQRPDGTAFVPVCKDIGWWGGDGALTAARGTRASVEGLTLTRVREDDGPPRWKVSAWAPKADAPGVSLVSATWVKQCRAWARHTPAGR